MKGSEYYKGGARALVLGSNKKGEVMKLKAEVQEISMNGFKLVKLIRPTDHRNHPAVSISMPNDVAEYIASLVNDDQEGANPNKEDSK